MVITYNQTELNTVAQSILDTAKTKILLFYGDMGAGKTTLIKALLRALGADDSGSSPTFSLVNEYNSPEGPIFHFDFYRINDQMEALDMGFEEYINSEGWIFIEWPQKIEKLLGPEVERIVISTNNQDSRTLKFC